MKAEKIQKNLVISLSILIIVACSEQSEKHQIEIIDLSTTQVRLMNAFENHPIEERNTVFLDSIFRPNRELWEGYLGEESDFLDWTNGIAFEELSKYNLKVQNIDLNKLNQYFFKTLKSMTEFTGHSGKGKWYIFFGPKWTNLGGFGDGTMLIDLAHESNNSLEDISKFFPHEINHQIYSNNVSEKENKVLYRILNEGFAVYVSHLFHDGKTSKAEELAYREAEYEFCLQNEGEIMALLKANYESNDEKLSSSFASRGYKFSEEYPGAIGYYIGFRIVEEFVKRNGEDSWKDIYSMSPEDVLNASGILEE